MKKNKIRYLRMTVICSLLIASLSGIVGDGAFAQEGTPESEPVPETTPEPDEKIPRAPLPKELNSDEFVQSSGEAELWTAAILGVTTRVSVSTSGAQANGYSSWPSISADGRYVAFESFASTLVAGDTNDCIDIFVRDRLNNTTKRVSVNSSGGEGNGDSRDPHLSADGRYVTFYSAASNLVSDDTNETIDVFVHDRDTGETTRVSLSSSGDEGNGESSWSTISGNGLFVAFESLADNLVPDDTNGALDMFVHDRDTGETTRVSVSSSGEEGNGESGSPATRSISDDGRYVVFFSDASNLVANDTNGYHDVFLHDRNTSSTTRISVNADGEEGNNLSANSSISPDGHTVVFNSKATNFIENDNNDAYDVFVYDVDADELTHVSVSSTGEQSNQRSFLPSLSGDGQLVIFYSEATNLVANDTNELNDVFLHNRQTGATSRLSMNNTGMQGNDWSIVPAIAADTLFPVFESVATNLVIGDTNAVTDIFVRAWEHPISTLNVKSTATYDGWVLELARTSSSGGSLNRIATTLRVGDDALNRQYRSILHFNTAALPDNAVITAVKLQVKRASYTGTYAFNTHGSLYVDMRRGAFSGNNALQTADWQTPASKWAAGKIPKTSTSNWHTLTLTAANFKYINKTGVTQFRLRFGKQDNGDNGEDYVNFYSGNAGTANRPKLIITYYVP